MPTLNTYHKKRFIFSQKILLFFTKSALLSYSENENKAYERQESGMPETILLCIAAVFCAIGILYSIRCIFMQIYRKHRPKSRIVIGVQNSEERMCDLKRSTDRKNGTRRK